MVAPPYQLDKNEILLSGETKLLLTEGESKIWMAPKTVIKVASLREPSAEALTLDAGKIRVKLAPPEAAKWRYETRSVVAGVRGTEFYVTTAEEQENWCVVEGKVEAQLAEGESLLIPAGQGAQLRNGLPTRKVSNSNFAVAQWQAETSGDTEVAFFPRIFQSNTRLFPVQKDVLISFTGLLLYKENFNADFNNDVYDQANLTRLHLYPGLLYRGTADWQFTPRVSFVGNQPEAAVDRDSAPGKVSNRNVVVTLSEASAAFVAAGISSKWGLQKLVLAEQSYLSDGKASVEPVTHLGVTAKKSLGAWDVSVALTKAQEGLRPGDGLFPQSLALLELKDDSGWINAYVLRVDSQSQTDFARSLFHQNVGGFLLQDRGERWDYKISKIFQSGNYQSSSSALQAATEGGFADLTIGGYFGSRTRAFARYLQADENYMALAPAAFYLGLSPSLVVVSNIRQMRLGAELRVSESASIAFEHIQSNQVSNTGLVNYRAAGSVDSNIGEEDNLQWRQTLNEANKVNFMFYRYVPHWRSSGSDPSWGGQIFAVFGY